MFLGLGNRLELPGNVCACARHGFAPPGWPTFSLIGLFWPESSPDKARHSLRQALYVLRKEVGSGALRTRGNEEVGIDPSVIACDAARFQLLARSGGAADAMEQYGGELLPGFYVDDAPEFERWLDVERVRLRRLAAQLCWNLVEEAGQRGDHLRAVRHARKAVDLDPFDETALHRLIELLGRTFDQPAAESPKPPQGPPS